jgi:hypothetical protein
MSNEDQKPQIDDGGPVGLYPVVRSQGKHAFDVLSELAEQEQHLRASMAKKAPDARPNIVRQQFPTVEALNTATACPRCGGSGFVPDGEITGSGGIEYENGPVQCVKDCPECTAHPSPEAPASPRWCKHIDAEGNPSWGFHTPLSLEKTMSTNFPQMPVVESMTQAIDRPENWVFREWVNWHHADATPHEKYLMLASWKEAKLNTINIDSEKREPDAWQSRANPNFLTTDRNQVSQWIASGYGVRALYANGQKDGLTGDQLYAITQLYNAVKDSGIEYHENSNLVTAMRTVVEWFRT